MAFLSGKTYIHFSAGYDLLSWLVCQKTGCAFSHCDFLMSDETLLGALPNHGVQVRKPEDLLKFKRSLILEAPVENGWEFAKTQIGRPYDWGAIIGMGIPFPRDWHDDSRWFCSELIIASLLEAGLTITSPNAWGVSPRDLLLSPLLNPARL